MTLLQRRHTRKLLGAQIVGRWQAEVAKRFDVFAGGGGAPACGGPPEARFLEHVPRAAARRPLIDPRAAIG